MYPFYNFAYFLFDNHGRHSWSRTRIPKSPRRLYDVCLGVCRSNAVCAYKSVYSYPNTDATRFGAQVISGIGFLGAGSIIVTRHNEVRGLTTAAGLWVAAALGLAVGAGFYIGAIIGVIFSVFALLVLKKIDVYIKQHAKSMEIYMEYTEPFSLQTLHSYLKEQEFEIYEMKRGKAKTLEEEFGTLTFSIRLPKKLNHQEVLNSFYNIEGVDYIEEIA